MNQIPPYPDFIPADVKATTENKWTTKIPPQGIAFFLGCMKQYLEQFGNTVTVEDTTQGWTLTVNLPSPRQDAILP